MQQSNGRTVLAQGRIVWTVGDLFRGRVKTDMHSRQPVIDQKTGEKIQEYGFGLAIPKSVLSQMADGQPGHVWRVLHEEAQTMFNGGQIPPSFAMKFKDGDGVDDKGVPFSQREGYAGHIVLSCTTRLPMKFFKWENNTNIAINEGIKCGDYVNVQLTIKAHAAQGQGKAGLYVNPSAVQLLGYGTAIVNTPSGDQIFGVGQPPTMGSATPIAPPGQIMPTQAPMMPPAAPQPQTPPPSPHYGVLPPSHQPPMGAAPMGNGQFMAPTSPTYPVGAYPAPVANTTHTGFSAPMNGAGPATPPSIPGFPR